MYNQLKRTIKTKYYTDLFERRKHDIRKTWQIRNSLVRDRSNKSTFPYNFRMDNQKWTYPKTIADELYNYFTEVGSKLAKSISKIPKEYHEYLPGTLNGNPIYLVQTDQKTNLKNHRFFAPVEKIGTRPTEFTFH